MEEIEELKSRLLEAEAMYQQLKKRQMQISTMNNTHSDLSPILQNNSLLLDAKKELQKEKALLANLKSQQASLNSNMSIRNGEDPDMEDTENGQESMSEDESDDDSERKGLCFIFLHIFVMKS